MTRHPLTPSSTSRNNKGSGSSTASNNPITDPVATPITDLKPYRQLEVGVTPASAAHAGLDSTSSSSYPYPSFSTPGLFSATPSRPIHDPTISDSGAPYGYQPMTPIGNSDVSPSKTLPDLGRNRDAAAPSSTAADMSGSTAPASTASESLQRVTGQAAAPVAEPQPTQQPQQAAPAQPASSKQTTAKSKAAISHAEANAALQGGSAVPTVYLATYSNVPVFEITVRGIAVMRRRNDGWLNATSILKIAGVEKTKRTKILEKNILTGQHEKIQGGYGKFQGTWIPLERAQQLAAEHNVAHILKPILEFDPSTAGQLPKLYQRRKPQPAARNTSTSAIHDGRASGTPTSSKTYSPAPSLGPTAGPSQQPRFLSLRPPKEAENRSLSPALFLPPGGGGLLNTTGTVMSPAAPLAIPAGSSQQEQEALRGYAQYGYVPQGVPLPDPQGSSAATAGKKRAAGASEAEADDASVVKRARVASPAKSQEGRVSELVGGLSPVKDLNSLGPSGGVFRAASAPRANRVAVGVPEDRTADGSVPRYADRAVPPKPYDEGEKRMRDHLVGLFAEEDASRSKGPGTPVQNGISGTASGASPANHTDGPLAGGDGKGAPPGSAASDVDSPVARFDALLGELREKASLGGLGGTGSDGPQPTVDLVTDDHGHTALHWASALCRLPLVKVLTARPPREGGANIHAGNHAGETALHRSVLVTNSYDASSFPALLQLLAASLNTRDFKKRTVLHHIALVAGLKGRAASARYYMACVLEYLATEGKGAGVGKYAGLIDAQDEDGETALGIVARLGNASMVRMLLDVGARKDQPNALGIRPADWGIEASTDPSNAAAGGSGSSSTAHRLPLSTAHELATRLPHDIVASLGRPAQGPVMKSSEVRERMTSALDDLQQAFERELKEKQSAVDVVQGHLQAATRDLASRRRNVAAAQARVAEKDEAKQRVRNLRRALGDHFQISPEDPAFAQRAHALIELAAARSAKQPQATTANGGDQMDVDGDDAAATARSADEVDGPLVDIKADLQAAGSAADDSAVSVEELVRLRWLVKWYGTSCDSLQRDIESLEGASAKKEMQCQQVVAMCANVPQDKVESMLDDLLTAMESDGQEVDLARVANFMQKVGKVPSTAPAVAAPAKSAVASTAQQQKDGQPAAQVASSDSAAVADASKIDGP